MAASEKKAEIVVSRLPDQFPICPACWPCPETDALNVNQLGEAMGLSHSRASRIVDSLVVRRFA